MHILCVNIGAAQPTTAKAGLTGIFKQPQPGPVEIGPLGLKGDTIVDTRNHGGPDQAVYLYAQPDYDWWAKDLGRDMSPGLFGENLTIAGLESAKVLIGDRFEIGEVLLEATSPRIPCATFAARMGNPGWVKRFHKALRPGVYVRVLKTGSVRAGDPIRHLPFAGEPIPIIEMMNDYKNPAPERMRRFLKAPLHRDLQARYETALAGL